MAKAFKEEYKNCTVVVRTQFGRKVTIETATANPNDWASIPEFGFIFEDEGASDVKPVKKSININEFGLMSEEEVTEEAEPSLSDLTLKELREKFPNIKDTSRSGFLKQLGQ